MLAVAEVVEDGGVLDVALPGGKGGLDVGFSPLSCCLVGACGGCFFELTTSSLMKLTLFLEAT